MSGPLWPVLVLSHVCLSSPVGFRAIFQDVLPPGPCMDDQHILHTQLKHHVLLNFLPQGAVSVELCWLLYTVPIRFCFIMKLVFLSHSS